MNQILQAEGDIIRDTLDNCSPYCDDCPHFQIETTWVPEGEIGTTRRRLICKALEDDNRDCPAVNEAERRIEEELHAILSQYAEEDDVVGALKEVLALQEFPAVQRLYAILLRRAAP